MDISKNSKLHIILTGGHAATPGIAIAEELRSRHPEAELFWIGSKYAIPGTHATTLEYKILPEIGVKFYPLIVGKLQTKFTRYTIPLLLSIPLSFIQSLWLLLKLKPKVIVSFGGFSSFPVMFWGWILRVPVILHEQTVAAGRASLFSSYFASKIALAREGSLKYFPKNKSVVTGNPILTEMLAIKPKVKLNSTKTILVVGGSRGSEFVNEEIFKIIPQLLMKYKVIHITGERDFEKYKGKGSLGYKILAFVDPRDMPRYYDEADVIIARSGASTVSEVIYIKRPTIFIPLPRTFMDEQYRNAKFAEDFRIARVLSETDVAKGLLLPEINKIFSDWQKIVDSVLSKVSPDFGASQKIVGIIEKYI